MFERKQDNDIKFIDVLHVLVQVFWAVNNYKKQKKTKTRSWRDWLRPRT